MADRSFTMGLLRSAIIIELHTPSAVRLWSGRRMNQSASRAHIIGMPRFLEIMGQIKIAASRDNPWADWWMLRMEEKLVQSRQQMNALQEQITVGFQPLADSIIIHTNLNTQPARFPLFVQSQLGYQGIYLLTDFDKLARQVMLAFHLSIITRPEMYDWLEGGSRIIRSTFSLAQQYQHIPLTRQDIALNTELAREATKKLGELPEDILLKTRRSTYAPAIFTDIKKRP